MVKIVIPTTLSPDISAFIGQFGHTAHVVPQIEEECTPELIALNASSALLVIFSDEIVHYNINDLAVLDLSHPGQIYCYRELAKVSSGPAPQTYKKFPGPPEPLLSSAPYHDAFFAQAIYFLPAKTLSADCIGSSFSSMAWDLVPMPRFGGIFPASGGERLLFLDRDGVINVDKFYVYKVEDCEIIPDIYPVLEWGKENNFKIAVLTNQSGIARRMYTCEDAEGIHRWMAQHFDQKGLSIGFFEMAPFHHDGAEGPLKKHSHLRKPFPGMALKVGEQIPINLRQSFMVGDKKSDILWLPLLRSYVIKGRYELGEDISSCQNLGEVLKNLKKDSSA
ncbi:MAG: HAD-IIIA family hydrolase [Bdellovibrio sp.]|nr:HAD-IIIA family hydrolase [Bdellovibrio sp.]